MVHAEAERPLTVRAFKAFLRTAEAELAHTNLTQETKECFLYDLAQSNFPLNEDVEDLPYVLCTTNSRFDMPDTLAELKAKALEVATETYQAEEKSEHVSTLQLQQVVEKAYLAALKEIRAESLSRMR
jgi:hypothetical protein